ncbi:hypothetical protein GCM10010302_41830 [Streptomyces polychromogenes]|uniref:Uncharacterized protein n=1 Tax=Streptomyces polychromogenes TaxID=67342 RepID=A0ABN0VGC4_9ACTN
MAVPDLPLGALGHEGSTVIVGLNGLRLRRTAVEPRMSRPGKKAAPAPLGDRGGDTGLGSAVAVTSP